MKGARGAAAAAALGLMLAVPAPAGAAPMPGWSATGPSAAGSSVRPAAVGEAAGCTDPSARIPQRPAALSVLQAGSAWPLTQGQGVVVAVVDSGVDAGNPHLAGVLAGGTDLVGDGAGSAGYADGYGHGTAVAGEIAAQAIPGSGVQGLAPGARILSVRVFAGTDDQTIAAGHGPSIRRLADGIRYAADARAQVINVSLSTTVDDPALREAVEYATQHGSLVVASAGNRDSSLAVEKDQQDGVRYPAGYPGVLGVAATDTAGVVTDASIHGAHVALAAPGQEVLTTATGGGDCVYAGDTPATSFATGYAAAAAALVAAAHPEESPAQWAYRLTASANRAHPGTKDDVSGWGVVQPYEAMVLVPGPQTQGPENPFTASAAEAGPTGAAPVSVRRGDDAAARQSAAATLIAVVAGTLLGTVAVLGLLAARRRRQSSPAG